MRSAPNQPGTAAYERPVRRRVVATVAAVGVLSLLATACSSGGSSPASGSSAAANAAPVTMSLWARDSEKSFIGMLATAFNTTHKDQVKVTVIPAANYVQKFGTAAAGGQAPDIASIDLVYAPYFASVGALADITDKTKALSYYNDLSPAHRRLATYQDKVYAMPFTAEASVLYYNKTLFTKAGIKTPPTSYAEIIADAAKVHALGAGYYGYIFSGACAGCNNFEFSPHVWASGGDILNADGTKAQFDSSQVTDALTMYRTMWAAGDMPNLAKTDDGSGALTAFEGGKIGMIPLGAFAVASLKAAKVDFGLTPLPGKTGGSSAFAGGDEIAIPSGSKHPDQAWEFLKWATDKQAQTVLAQQSIVPVRTDLLKTIYYPLDPRNKILGAAMSTGHTPYSVVENALLNDNNGPYIKMISQAVFTGDIHGAQQAGQKAAAAIISAGP